MLKSARGLSRPAFSIAEMVVSVGILAILGAIVVPSISRYLYEQKIEATAALLDSLSAAKNAFKRTVQVNPGHLSHLTTQIISIGSANADESACNGLSGTTRTFYTIGQGQFWSGAASSSIGAPPGPFFGRKIPTTGFPIGIGTANDQLVRTTVPPTNGFLMIMVPNVRYQDAIALNAYVDGADKPYLNRTDTSGAVRWTTTPSGASDVVTLLWFMGIGESC